MMLRYVACVLGSDVLVMNRYYLDLSQPSPTSSARLIYQNCKAACVGKPENLYTSCVTGFLHRCSHMLCMIDDHHT